MNSKNLHHFITTQLNPSQQDAVLHHSGPILVIAGAGSGKTRVITTRIAHLMLTQSVPSQALVALTFTNKAAKEMKERIAQFVPEGTILPFVGTFHSYSLLLLKKYARNTLTFHSILDEDDRTRLLTQIVQKHNLQKQISVKQIGHQISHIKNHFTHPTHSLQSGQVANDLIIQIYHAYEHEKSLNKTLDFDDLLLETFKLFDKNRTFAQMHHHMVRHILVDEYQDTNIIQHALLKQMCLEKNRFVVDSLCAVGDEDQSIYSWRGATVTNIMNFGKDFANTIKITLAQNYRCAQPILHLANHVISRNVQRNHKDLFSEKAGLNCVYHVIGSSEYKEAEIIAAALAQAKSQSDINKSAILYRTHFQSRALEEALIKKSIPYKIIGGIQFYERKEIKDLLAYVRLTVNPFDKVSFTRILNTPTRGLGDKCEEVFLHTWSMHPQKNFGDIGMHIIQHDLVGGKRAIALLQFLQIFQELPPHISASAILTYFIQKTHYIAYIQESYEKEEAQQKIENIHELINALSYFESQGKESVEQFLDEVALLQEHSQDSTDSQTVLLMTLHAAKGLEFDFVIIAGLEDGIFPSARSLVSPESIEEERRLLYVGITRAKEKLLLTRARSRYTFGNLSRQNPSRFLSELQTIYIPEHTTDYWNTQEFNTFFQAWFNTTEIKFMPHAQKNHRHDAPSQPSEAALWKLYQSVKHAQFGIGTIQKIENRGSQTILTIQFKAGNKKIESSFISPAH